MQWCLRNEHTMNENEGIFLRFLNLKSMQHKIVLRLLLHASAFQIWLVLFDQIN